MLEVCILHRALDDWEIKESKCCPTVGVSYLENHYLERQHEKYRCCLHWKTVFLAKTTMDDGNSLQIFLPLLSQLISRYTVNKKHDRGLIRLTRYLLTRWQNTVKMLFEFIFLMKIKHFLWRVWWNVSRVLPTGYLKTLFYKSQQKERKKTLSFVPIFPRKSSHWHLNKLLWCSSCFLGCFFGGNGLGQCTPGDSFGFFSVSIEICGIL